MKSAVLYSTSYSLLTAQKISYVWKPRLPWGCSLLWLYCWWSPAVPHTFCDCHNGYTHTYYHSKNPFKHIFLKPINLVLFVCTCYCSLPLCGEMTFFIFNANHVSILAWHWNVHLFKMQLTSQYNISTHLLMIISWKNCPRVTVPV